MPLADGARLGSYLILSALGAGGMGEVYRAHDTRLDRQVAVKILPPPSSLRQTASRGLNGKRRCGYHAAGVHPLTPEAIRHIATVHDRSWSEGQSQIARNAPDDDAVAAATRVHAVRFHESRESLAKIVGKFLGAGFLAGLPAVVIATPPHRDAIRAVLAGHYFDLSRLESANDLIMVDAADMLSRFMHDGMPNATMFTDAMIPVIEQACRGRKDCVIRAYGEMVDVLWQAGQTAAAIRLEMLWNQLAQTHRLLFCAVTRWDAANAPASSVKGTPRSKIQR